MKSEYWLKENYADTLAFPIDYNDKGVQLYWARLLASAIVRGK